MGDTTRISWSTRTVNFWIGCRHVDECCDHCYAESMVNRFRSPHAFDTVVRTKTWNDPKRWQKKAEETGRSDLVFTCSLSDFFIQQADQWRPEVWKIIKDTPNLIYQILTKRPELVDRRLPPDWGPNGYANVWMGTSIGMKKNLKRMDVLRKIPARVRFISAEPLLEDICPELEDYIEGFHQIIVGGESGNGTNNFRPMPTEWAARVLAICRTRNIAYWFKQSAAIRAETVSDSDKAVFMNTSGKLIQEYPAAYHEYPIPRTT